MLRAGRCTGLPISVTAYAGSHAILPNNDKFEINTNDGAGASTTITGGDLASSGRVVGAAVYTSAS
jgi:hypothetical protein